MEKRSSSRVFYDRTRTTSRLRVNYNYQLTCPSSHPVMCDENPTKPIRCRKTRRECLYKSLSISEVSPRIEYPQQYKQGVVFLDHCIKSRVLEHIDSRGYRRVIYLFADDHGESPFRYWSRYPRMNLATVRTSSPPVSEKKHFSINISQVLRVLSSLSIINRKKLDIFVEYTLSSLPMTQQAIRGQHHDDVSAPALLSNKNLIETIILWSPKSGGFRKEEINPIFSIHHVDIRRGDLILNKIHNLHDLIRVKIYQNKDSATPISNQQLMTRICQEIRQHIDSNSLSNIDVIHDIFVRSKIFKEISMVEDLEIKRLLTRKIRELEVIHAQFLEDSVKISQYVKSQVNETQELPIQKNLLKMTAYIIDIYTLARMFKVDRDGNRKSHCVYIAGGGHIDHLTELLLSAGARVLFDQSNQGVYFNKDEVVPIDISALFANDFWFI